MAVEQLDLKVLRTGQTYVAVPIETIRQWIRERRVTADDLVRPAGAAKWMKVSLAPELTGTRPAAKRAEPIPASYAGPRISDDLGIAAPAYSRTRQKRRLADDPAMDMTPMIDVTFQLLIFFMLTNKAVSPSLIEVPQVRHGQGIDPEGRQVLLIDEAGTYFLGDRAVAENSVESLDSLAERVAQNANSDAVDGPMEVIIHAHKQSRHMAVRELMQRLQIVDGLGAIRLGVQEKD